MGGNATFSGTTYQARIIALVYVHILAEMRLGWFSPTDDTPSAVSGETGGPGDDAAVELASGPKSVEVQAKHGVAGRDEIRKILARMQDGDPSTKVVLAVNRVRSPRWLLTAVASDIEQLRSGRDSDLHGETVRLINEMDESAISREVLHRLYIVGIDIDKPEDPESKQAIALLESIVLAEPNQSESAWAILVNDASDICARKQRRNRNALVELLSGAKIKVRPLAKDDKWLRQLDFTKAAISKRHAAAALAILAEVEKNLAQLPTDQRPEPFVFFRLHQQRAAAFVLLQRPKESLESALRALDYDPKGLNGLTSASTAARMLGQLDDALKFARRAVDEHPHEPLAWGTLAQALAAKGEAIQEPPPDVIETRQYRLALVELAIQRDDVSSLLALTQELMAAGERSPVMLFHRANTLIDTHVGASNDRYAEVERLASEAIAGLDDEANPLTVKAYLVRAAARRLMGRDEDADGDLAVARTLNANDVDVITQIARILVEDGKPKEALEVLRHPSVEEEPRALLIRGRAAAELGSSVSAKADITKALNQLDGSPYDDKARFLAAELAIDLGDSVLAREIIREIPDEKRNDAPVKTLEARIAFLEGNVEKGAELYREIAKHHAHIADPILTELGTQFLAAKRPLEAVKVFQEIDPGCLPKNALRPYVRSLLETHNLAESQKQIDNLAQEGPLPTWALAVATEIALQQEDSDRAIRHLDELVNRENSTLAARIELTRILIEAGEQDTAKEHINRILESGALKPIERMQVAQLLHGVGRSSEAMTHAHTAFLAKPDDPRMHRAFIAIVFFSKSTPPTAEVVSQDTYVRLTDAAQVTLEYTIRESAAVDPRAGDLSTESAKKSGLMGLRRGDKWARSESGWQAHDWVVEEILPILVRDAQDAAQNYEKRFPSEPFFLTSINIGDGKEVKDFAPIISTLEERKKRVSEVLRMYSENAFPLGMMARLLGGEIPDMMEQASAGDQVPGLFVEFGDLGGYERSRAAAVGATSLVISRSALETMSVLGMLDEVACAYTLFAPRSLREALRRELDDADRMVSEGHKLILSSDAGLALQDFPPHDSRLISRRDKVKALLAFVDSKTRVIARPLETIKATDSDPNSMREIIGSDSYDAAMLAGHLRVPLYADDFGLRRLETAANYPSVSSVTLVEGLLAKELVADETCYKRLGRLAQLRYLSIQPSRKLLWTALQNASDLSSTDLQRTFATLTFPGLTLRDAARIVAQAVRSEATADIQLVSLDRIVALSLTAMSKGWPVTNAASELMNAVSQELALWPSISARVIQACKAFVQEALTIT
jgi:tetratricopeptide (TPR) repeat protein